MRRDRECQDLRKESQVMELGDPNTPPPRIAHSGSEPAPAVLLALLLPTTTYAEGHRHSLVIFSDTTVIQICTQDLLWDYCSRGDRKHTRTRKAMVQLPHNIA